MGFRKLDLILLSIPRADFLMTLGPNIAHEVCLVIVYPIFLLNLRRRNMRMLILEMSNEVV